MTNFTDFFPAAGATSGGSGGSLPETEIFTSTGFWNVPQSVQDEISSEGHAEVGIFLVGGGGTSTQGGEIVNRLIKITAADYDDGVTPVITVVVGAAGGHSGITLNQLTFTETLYANGTNRSGGTDTIPITGNNNFAVGPNGFPLVSLITVPLTSFFNGASGPGGLVALTWSGGGSPTISSNVATFSTPTEFDGTLGWNQTFTGFANPGTFDTVYSIANGGFTTTQGGVGPGNQLKNLSPGLFFTLNQGPQAVRQAREGGNASSPEFLNLTTSTEGYFGGYSRVNGTRANSGQGGQSGYVQIFYN
jgi:hypothetical protein